MARRIESLFVRYRRHGDVAALGKVFDAAAPEILRVAMHFARHPAEAEDLLQETFLTAIRRAEAYEAGRPLMPWLIGILRNHARRLHRQRRRLVGALEAAGDEQAYVEPWLDVAWCDDIAAAVEALQDSYRQVLVLKLRHDKSPAEIAVLLDVPPATVRSQLHRGLERLRKQLKPDARTRITAVLPVGVGPGGVREQVLEQAAEVAVATAVTTATLPLVVGGLVMTKKSMLIAGALLCALVAGAAVWVDGMFDPDEDRGEQAASVSAEGSSVGAGETRAAAPTLEGVGSPGEPLMASADTETPEPPVARVWPPEIAIPEDKGSVAGTIRFTDGTPLVGARVALWGSPHVAAETDAEGRYHIHADWVHRRSLFLRLGRDDQPDHLGLILSREIVLRNGKLVMHDVTLERGIGIQSTVVDNRTGDAIADAKVVLRRQPFAQGQANSGFGLSDERGRFAFPYVPRGTYTIQLEAEGYEAIVESYDLEHMDLPRELELQRSRPLVVQFENLPEGAIGTVVGCDLSRMDASAFSVMTKPKIAPDGTLRVDAPEAGTYRLTLYRSSHLPRLERDIVIPEGPLDPIVWRLKEGARVAGNVVDADGAAIGGVRVTITGAAGGAKTDADGGFELMYVPAGKRSLRVHVGRAWVRFAVMEVPARGEVRLELRAPGTSTLTGLLKVGDRAADRYSAALKIFDVMTKKEVAATGADPKGRFEVPYLPAGKYEVLAWSSVASPQAVTVEVGGGQTLDLGTISLVPFVKVPVRFLLPSGELAPKDLKMHVRAYTPSKSGSGRLPSHVEAGGRRILVWPLVQVDAFGKTWVAGLPVGRHRLEITPDGYETVSLEVEAKPGATEPIEVRIQPK